SGIRLFLPARPPQWLPRKRLWDRRSERPERLPIFASMPGSARPRKPAKGRNRFIYARPTPSRRQVSYCPEFRHDPVVHGIRESRTGRTRKRNSMRIPFLTTRTRDYALEPLTVADSPAISAIHQEDFVRPWTDGEFASLFDQDTVFGFAARETGKGAAPPVGFVLARLAAGEGASLTDAVAREHRRQGLGWRLMDAVLRELHGQRA